MAGSKTKDDAGFGSYALAIVLAVAAVLLVAIPTHPSLIEALALPMVGVTLLALRCSPKAAALMSALATTGIIVFIDRAKLRMVVDEPGDGARAIGLTAAAAVVIAAAVLQRRAQRRAVQTAAALAELDDRRRAAEEAARMTQERLALALKSARLGTFEWDFTTDISVWSPELLSLYGMDGRSAQNQL